MRTPVLAAAVLVALVAVCAVWVLRDAEVRQRAGRPVSVVLLGMTIDQPATWAVLCLLGSVLFVPMYLVARRQDG
ncbi:MAG TPA: hypothetical protein VFL46_10920 [Phycicoccus sp.]|nr:hypothetical protein [Phycicoccus sp.]